MGFLDFLFKPKKHKNVFSLKRYIKDLEAGEFNDRFNLGVIGRNGGEWQLKNFVNEPNAIFGGAMGSGKSAATLFTSTTWMLANSDKTILFLIDTIKEAGDYSGFFKYPQVYTCFSETKVHKVVDLVFDEIKKRKDMLKPLGAKDILDYEKKVKSYNRANPKNKLPEKMARIVLLMEEFHTIPYQIMNFSTDSKKELTTAAKFSAIVRTGRALGVWILACSQKMTSSDIPSEIIPNLTQKQVFKVSKAESTYFLSNPLAAEIPTEHAGRCITEEGPVQYPYMNKELQEILLERYMKPLDAGCAYLNDKIIRDYLGGKSTEDMYRFKNLSELAMAIMNYDEKVVIGLMHKKMGHTVEEPKEEDSLSFLWLVKWPRAGGRFDNVAVMSRIGKKVLSKSLSRLNNMMAKYNCSNGIIYTTEENLNKSVYKEAEELNIEILDHEDFIDLAKKIELKEKTGSKETFDPSELADDDKESGAYQDRRKREKEEIKKELQAIEDKKKKEIEEAEMKAKELVSQMDMYPEVSDDELESEELEFPDDIEIPEDVEDKSLDEKIEEAEDDFFINTEKVETLPDDSTDEEKEESRHTDEYADMLIGDKAATEKLKKIPVRPKFNLRQDEMPSLLYHLQRNKDGDVYRCLFMVVSDQQLKHKFFIDRKVEGEFSRDDKVKLGITATSSWNKTSGVLNDEDFKVKLNKYLENFASCEFPITSYCWEGDKEFIDKIVKKTENVDKPKTLEHLIQTTYQFSPEETKRNKLIEQFKITKVKKDMFEEIGKDLELFLAIF